MICHRQALLASPIFRFYNSNVSSLLAYFFPIFKFRIEISLILLNNAIFNEVTRPANKNVSAL